MVTLTLEEIDKIKVFGGTIMCGNADIATALLNLAKQSLEQEQDFEYEIEETDAAVNTAAEKSNLPHKDPIVEEAEKILPDELKTQNNLYEYNINYGLNTLNSTNTMYTTSTSNATLVSSARADWNPWEDCYNITDVNGNKIKIYNNQLGNMTLGEADRYIRKLVNGE